jgi:hypothetical protein
MRGPHGRRTRGEYKAQLKRVTMSLSALEVRHKGPRDWAAHVTHVALPVVRALDVVLLPPLPS